MQSYLFPVHLTSFTPNCNRCTFSGNGDNNSIFFSWDHSKPSTWSIFNIYDFHQVPIICALYRRRLTAQDSPKSTFCRIFVRFNNHRRVFLVWSPSWGVNVVHWYLSLVFGDFWLIQRYVKGSWPMFLNKPFTSVWITVSASAFGMCRRTCAVLFPAAGVNISFDEPSLRVKLPELMGDAEMSEYLSVNFQPGHRIELMTALVFALRKKF